MSKPIDWVAYAARTGSEDASQIALFGWAAEQKQYPELKFMFHVPNGGYRNKKEAGKLKAMGVKTGCPDIWLPVRRGEWSGLVIELKKPKIVGKTKGRVQDNQDVYGNFLQSQGYGFMVCYGFEEAKNALIEYLNYGK